MLRSFEKNGCPTLHKSNILLLNKKNYFNTLLYLWKLQYLCYEKLQSSREKSSSGKSGCFCKIVKTIYQIISLKNKKRSTHILLLQMLWGNPVGSYPISARQIFFLNICDESSYGGAL